MVTSTIIFRTDGLPLSGSVDDDNSPELLEQKKKIKVIVTKISSNAEPKVSIDSGAYTINYLILNSIIYFCICDKNYPKKLAFSYLSEISTEFNNSHGADAMGSNVRPYQFLSFDSFMSKTKKIYQDSRAQSNLDKLNSELEDVKKVMNKNIEDLLYRGDSLDSMSDLSFKLRDETKKYRKAAQRINFEALLRQYAPVAFVSLMFVFLIWYIFLRRG
ncbi:hypothetical protein PACTADRAFT_18113 [Pachysolen tannophilus NRRL Y-2460]|uniref:Protein transport protein SEC22 n=1 Tax=Pachysolen tannophilus NRRL Y-2460 TaxID=669874 RepID=A0A1E4TRM5_PACTA|nr:hypothetical protein PACTADRAFT_18113 [Pachysolen tannophilus NRRL Y-2460]